MTPYKENQIQAVQRSHQKAEKEKECVGALAEADPLATSVSPSVSEKLG